MSKSTAAFADPCASFGSGSARSGRPTCSVGPVAGWRSTQVHHAAIDGVSGAEMLTLLFDLSPEAPTPGPAPEFRPQPGPGAARLRVQAIGRLAWRPVEVAKLAVNGSAPSRPSHPSGPLVGNLLGLGRGPSGDGGVIKSSTPPGRAAHPAQCRHLPRIGGLPSPRSPLDEVKFVKNTFEVSVNDVVMAISAGALRRWLLAHDALPDGPLVAMVPVSIRGADDGVGGNKVSAARGPAHATRGPGRAARGHPAGHDDRQGATGLHPAGLVDDVSDFAPPALTARAARVMFASKILHRLPAFNTVISTCPVRMCRSTLRVRNSLRTTRFRWSPTGSASTSRSSATWAS